MINKSAGIQHSHSSCIIYVDDENLKTVREGSFNRFTQLFKTKIGHQFFKTSSKQKTLKITITAKNKTEKNEIKNIICKYLSSEFDQKLQSKVTTYGKHLSFSIETKHSPKSEKTEKTRLSPKENCLGIWENALKNPKEFAVKMIELEKTCKDNPLAVFFRELFLHFPDAESKASDLLIACSKKDVLYQLPFISSSDVKEQDSEELLEFIHDIYGHIISLYLKGSSLKDWKPELLLDTDKHWTRCFAFVKFIRENPHWVTFGSEENVTGLLSLLFESMEELLICHPKAFRYCQRALEHVAVSLYNAEGFDKLQLFYQCAAKYKKTGLLAPIFTFKKAVQSAQELEQIQEPVIRAKAFIQHLIKFPLWPAQVGGDKINGDAENLLKQISVINTQDPEILDELFSTHFNNKHFHYILQEIASQNNEVFKRWSIQAIFLACGDSNAFARNPISTIYNMTFLYKCDPKQYFEICREKFCALFYILKEREVASPWLMLYFLLENIEELPEEKIDYKNKVLTTREGKKRVFAAYQEESQTWDLYRLVKKMHDLGLQPIYDLENDKINLQINKAFVKTDSWTLFANLLIDYQVDNLAAHESISKKLVLTWIKKGHFDKEMSWKLREKLQKAMKALGWTQEFEVRVKQQQKERKKRPIKPLLNGNRHI